MPSKLSGTPWLLFIRGQTLPVYLQVVRLLIKHANLSRLIMLRQESTGRTCHSAVRYLLKAYRPNGER